MAEMANAAFDRFETVDMLLVFDNFDGEETGALFDLEGIKAQFRAIVNVGRYVVVGAPESARALIEGMGAILPLKAMTFDKGEEELAWVELEARPATATGTGYCDAWSTVTFTSSRSCPTPCAIPRIGAASVASAPDPSRM